MRGYLLPATLLCSALGVALGFTVAWLWATGIAALMGSAWATWAVLTSGGIDTQWADGVYLACWIGTAGNALSVYLRRPAGLFAVLVLSLNAGALCGALGALTGLGGELPQGLIGVFVLVPVSWAVRRGVVLPTKVISSWLIAIAALAAILQFVPVTPGYLPDHVE